MGELHLEVIRERIRSEYKVKLKLERVKLFEKYLSTHLGLYKSYVTQEEREREVCFGIPAISIMIRAFWWPYRRKGRG